MLEARSGVATPEKWLVDYFKGGADSYAGVMVDEETALKYSAYFCGVRRISETLGSIPLILYQRLKEGGKERAYNHSLYDKLHNSPNPNVVSMTFRSTLQNHLLTWGNAYAQIIWKQNQTIDSLYPLRPDRMTVKRDIYGELQYEYNYQGIKRVAIPNNQILHIPGFGFDGTVGYSIVRLARESLGLGLGTEEFGARFFGSGTHPGLIAEHPGRLGPDASDNLRKSLTEKSSGLGKSHKILILEEGMKAVPVGIPPEDAQFLETRKFQVTDVARWLNIPPHMIMDLERATFSNIEEQSLEFVIYTMRPWFVLWEQVLSHRLLSSEERKIYFFEHLIDALLRGDTKSRYEAYKIASDSGWFNADEIRAKENMNPQPNGMGKIYNVPLNFQNKVDWLNKEDKEENKYLRALNIEQRSIMERNNIVKNYNRIFVDAAGRFVRREGIAIKKAVNKYLKNGNITDFTFWLDKFYNELPEYIEKNMLPVIMTYGEMIEQSAAREIGFEWKDEQFDKFCKEYIEIFIKRHIYMARGCIRGILNNTEQDKLIEIINRELEEWKDKKPEKIAKNETVEANGAFTKRIYKLAGIRNIKWVNQDNNEYCRELDGKIIEIDQYFLREGTELQPEGKSPLKIESNKGHPPLFEGCSCTINIG